MVDGRDFVRYWVHNGFVNINSEKMCALTSEVHAYFDLRLVEVGRVDVHEQLDGPHSSTSRHTLVMWHTSGAEVP